MMESNSFFALSWLTFFAYMTMCGMCGMFVFMFNGRILVQNVGLRARAYCLKNEIHQEQTNKMIKLRSNRETKLTKKKETKFLQSTAEIEKSNKQYHNSHQKSEKETNEE